MLSYVISALLGGFGVGGVVVGSVIASKGHREKTELRYEMRLLEGLHEQCQSKNRELYDAASKSNKLIDELKGQVNVLSEKKGELEEVAEKFSKDLRNSWQLVQAGEDTINALHKELNEAREQLDFEKDVFKKEKETFAKRFSEDQEANQKLVIKIRSLEQQLAVVQNAEGVKETLLTELEGTKSELEAVQVELSETLERLEQIEGVNQSQSEFIEKMKADYTNTVNQANAIIESLNQTVASSSGELEKLQQDCLNYQRVIASYDNAMKEYGKSMASL